MAFHDLLRAGVLTACLAFSAAAARSAVITVQPGQSIAAAIRTAQPGDTVQVARGFYAEHLLIDKPITKEEAKARIRAIKALAREGKLR